jgi:hypothetical protein
MNSSKGGFSYPNPYTTPTILMGDNIPIDVCGRESIFVDEETFQNVICVPPFSTNILSIYQINNSILGKKGEFTPNSMVIIEITNDATIVVGKADHWSRLYLFSNFIPKVLSIVLLTHSYEVIKFCHE